MSHCHCTSSALPMLMCDPAVTCSGGCGSAWRGPSHSTGVAGSSRGSGQGGCCKKHVVNTQPAPDPEMRKQNLPFLTALWLSISLRLPRALGTSYFGNARVLQDVFGLRFQFRAPRSTRWEAGHDTTK